MAVLLACGGTWTQILITLLHVRIGFSAGLLCGVAMGIAIGERHALHPVPALIVTHYPEEIASQAPCRLFSLEGRPAGIMPVTQ